MYIISKNYLKCGLLKPKDAFPLSICPSLMVQSSRLCIWMLLVTFVFEDAATKCVLRVPDTMNMISNILHFFSYTPILGFKGHRPSKCQF